MEENKDWLETRKTVVGASEIATVIQSECTEEEIKKAMGSSAEEFMKDNPFSSPYMLYCFKKDLAKPELFSPVLSEYGHEMEKFATYYINQLYSNLKATNKEQKVIKFSELHKLAGYTPDAFVEFKKDMEFLKRDIRKGDKAIFEIKTNNLFQFMKNNKGMPEGQEELKFQYIMQAQYQLWIQNKIDPNFKWAVMAVMIAKDKSLDTDFEKGKAVIYCNNLNKDTFEKLCNTYDVYLWIYPIYKTLHGLFEIALNRWQKRLQDNNIPEPNFKKNKDIKIQNQFMKNAYDEIKIYSQQKYGADKKGIIKITEEIKINYPELYDEMQKDKLDREEQIKLKKEIDERKAKLIKLFLETKCLGFDFEKFTICLSKSGRGFTIRNNFKTTEETILGVVKVNSPKKKDFYGFI